MGGNARTIDRRRHYEKLEVLAQPLLHVAGERQSEIGIERALVKLIEQHRRDAFENGIVEDHAREHALGDDLDAGPARHFRAEAHAIADRLADLFAERRRHARSGGARREPARLEHEELHVLRPGLPGEHQRHTRGLAGARRGDQHGRVMGRERRRELRQHIVDRQRVGEVHQGSGAKTMVGFEERPAERNHARRLAQPTEWTLSMCSASLASSDLIT